MKRTLFIITAWLMGSIAFAQQGEILYFDLEPDSTCTFHNWQTPDPPLYLDVDRDGLCEWRFMRQYGDHQSITLELSPNAHPLIDTMHYFERLRINSECHFGDSATALEWGTTPRFKIRDLGEYPNQMLALRYQVEDGYCYGWMRFSARLYEPAPTVGASLIDLAIHETVYCTIPNYPLLIGQTDFTWDVEESEVQAFAIIHPNPTNGQVTITGKDLKIAEVFNTLGQCVATAKGQGERLTVNLSAMPAGVYFVNVTDGEGRKCVRKVVKE